MKKLLTFTSCCIAAISIPAYAFQTAPVSGFVRSFLLGHPIAHAKIKILETGQEMRTNYKGEFGPIQYPVGKPITLEFEKFGFKTTQSGTTVVPESGLTGPFNNITFQIPSIETYYLLSTIIGAKFDKTKCHVTTTITAYHKILTDVPQGEEHAQVTLAPYVNEKPFYFGIYKSGPLKDKTNPFAKGLVETSKDGGIGLFNLPPSDIPYTISASKAGKVFTSAHFICRPGAFINISPPDGPSANA